MLFLCFLATLVLSCPIFGDDKPTRRGCRSSSAFSPSSTPYLTATSSTTTPDLRLPDRKKTQMQRVKILVRLAAARALRSKRPRICGREAHLPQRRLLRGLQPPRHPTPFRTTFTAAAQPQQGTTPLEMLRPIQEMASETATRLLTSNDAARYKKVCDGRRACQLLLQRLCKKEYE